MYGYAQKNSEYGTVVIELLRLVIRFMIDMFDRAVPNDPFMLKYCLNRYKTQEISNKAVDDFLPASKFTPDWFATSKII